MKLGEPLDHLRIIVVKESGLLLIQSVNGGHIIGRQFEVKDVDVLTDTIRVNALRNADDASLKLAIAEVGDADLNSMAKKSLEVARELLDYRALAKRVLR